jgi:hypothetical protein
MDDAGDASAIGLAVHVIGIISAAASLQMTFDTFKTSLKKVFCIEPLLIINRYTSITHALAS